LIFNNALSERIRKFGTSPVVGDLVMIDEKSNTVKAIESEQEASQFKFDDVVLTLIGSQVIIPPNMESFYSTFLKERLGTSMDAFKNSNLPKFLQLPGAYRKILARAENLTWNILDNIRLDQVVIKSDVDILKQADGQNDPANEITDNSDDSSAAKAVVFKCSLKPGCYLTMAVREVTSAE
jgi:tRNA pseudouridine13 synthase